ncbi:MAG: lamin tail domain-containing protein, partial [Candidatus Promineifilaceae bacterium]|nr:lamin tail domain-containing protein [Candidatus Promineifilaceae bacterium]
EDPNSGEIDRVEYDGGTAFPDPTGASMSLISPALDNNVGANWCTASTSFGAGDFGTPGGANDCPGSVQPGVVIVNEIMNNPSAVGDNEGEWFEVYNTTTGDIDLNGWTIADNDGDSHLIANNGPLNVPAGGFLVLGRNADSATNGGVSVDYEYSGINLANGDDEVVLFDSTLNEVNRVEYDGGPAFPDPNGASMSLEDPALDNSVGANWCEAVTPFGDGDLGTPGSENICTLPAVPLTIMEIQGEAQVSPHLGQTVLTNGVITVVRSISFYMQDPNGDGNDATSDGILVFTGFEHSFAVGDLVEVEGNVSEFYPGGFGSGNLSTTEISNPTINLLSSGNSITPTVIGNGGRIPPNMVIEDDASGDVETQADFDPDDDGIDFYESLEGMYVQVNNAQVVGTDRFGELTVVGDNGANATILSPRGGVVIRPGDFNPERIIIDDTLILDEPDAAVGDMFAEVVGVMDYSFGNFKLFNSEPLVWIENNLPKETTTIEGSGSNVTIATFNVFNLNPGDPQAKFDELADQVVNRLNAPDVIGVQEIQDNSGPINDGVVAADQTYGLLIAAISAAGGPTYEYREVTPEDLQDGGAPGANIRVGFLFRPDRVSFIDRPGGDATTSTAPILSTDGVELTFSPGRIDPTNSAFTDSRKPIAGEFVFNNGQKVFVVVGHFNSKGGDDPLFGRVQPPTFGSEIQRHQQAAVVNSFVQDILALDPNSIVAVVGDLNDFQFSGPIQTLKGTELTNLIDTLPENEQYTYIFDGNSQVLDHILVSNNVVDKVNQVDIVHANAEYDQDLRATDHDPVVAELDLNLPPVCETSYPSQASLWPPNHEFVAVDVVVPDPDGDAVTITITSIFQDEAVDARGSGKTAPDGQGVGSPTAEVRSERVGSGNGRVYHINFIADDGQGHSCSGVVNVGVPISNDGSPAVDDGALFDSTIAP